MSPSVNQHLTPENGLIFRITHIDNVPWILEQGLHCASSSTQDPNFVSIGNKDLIGKRASRPIGVGPGGTLNDYIPFYFTPYTPMFDNILTGYSGATRRDRSEIAILKTSLPKVAQAGIAVLVSDRHALLRAAVIRPSLDHLLARDWSRIQARNYRYDPEDPERFERYQAEALIHRHLPACELQRLVCYRRDQAQRLQELATSLALPLKVSHDPDWYVR